MMADFMLYLKMGLFHVLDITSYDHILFLIVLAVVYNAKQWKKVLYLITLFTLGHTLTLALAAYGIIAVNEKVVEFLIPCTILITGLANIVGAKKASVGKDNLNLFFALSFGLIHGLGFSSYFKMMLATGESKLFPLLEFALGIEIAQAVIILIILLIGWIFQTIFKVSRRDWILITSAIVIGVSIPVIVERIFW